MPLTLISPRKGRWANWRARGTHLGTYVDRSTGVRDKRVAKQIRDSWERAIERGEYGKSPEARGAELTYGAAALAYMQAGGEERPQTKLLNHFQDTPLSQIDQAAIDAAAIALFPDRDPATRNREVYTPVSAVLKHAGVRFELRRPKGSRGKVVTDWLWPEQAFRILDAAIDVDLEFGLLLAFLCYTGCRLSEALRIQCDEIRPEENFAYLRHTKNGEARAVHLPPHLVEVLKKHPRKLDRASARVFRFHKSGNLYFLLESACMIACGLAPPKRVKAGKKPPRPKYDLDWVNFHTFCHTWGTWMRRYGGLDVRGLVGTGRWKNEQSAGRYAHVVVSEESRRVELLPVPQKKGA